MAFRDVVAAPTLPELEQFIRQTLCAHNRWEADQTGTVRSLVRRGGQPCGLFLQVVGPNGRSHSHAIWAGDEGRVLFYDTAGRRFAEVRLSDAPDPLGLAVA